MNALSGVVLGAFIIAMIIFVPFMGIWALNTLFGLSIGYSLNTWAAMVIISGMFKVNYKPNS